MYISIHVESIHPFCDISEIVHLQPLKSITNCLFSLCHRITCAKEIKVWMLKLASSLGCTVLPWLYSLHLCLSAHIADLVKTSASIPNVCDCTPEAVRLRLYVCHCTSVAVHKAVEMEAVYWPSLVCDITVFAPLCAKARMRTWCHASKMADIQFLFQLFSCG